MIYQYLWYPIFPNRHLYSQWEDKFSCFNFHKYIFEDRITSFVFLVMNHDMIPFELAIVFYNIFYEHTYLSPTCFAQFLPFITVVHHYLHTWPDKFLVIRAKKEVFAKSQTTIFCVICKIVNDYFCVICKIANDYFASFAKLQMTIFASFAKSQTCGTAKSCLSQLAVTPYVNNSRIVLRKCKYTIMHNFWSRRSFDLILVPLESLERERCHGVLYITGMLRLNVIKRR